MLWNTVLDLNNLNCEILNRYLTRKLKMAMLNNFRDKSYSWGDSENNSGTMKAHSFSSSSQFSRVNWVMRCMTR